MCATSQGGSTDPTMKGDPLALDHILGGRQCNILGGELPHSDVSSDIYGAENHAAGWCQPSHRSTTLLREVPWRLSPRHRRPAWGEKPMSTREVLVVIWAALVLEALVPLTCAHA